MRLLIGILILSASAFGQVQITGPSIIQSGNSSYPGCTSDGSNGIACTGQFSSPLGFSTNGGSLFIQHAGAGIDGPYGQEAASPNWQVIADNAYDTGGWQFSIGTASTQGFQWFNGQPGTIPPANRLMQLDPSGNLIVKGTITATGGGGGTPGGSSGQMQYNNAGAFGGTSGITYIPPPGAPALVQTNTACNAGGAATVTTASPLTIGNTLIVGVIQQNTPSPAVTDTLGNVYVQDATAAGASFDNEFLFHAAITHAGTATISATPSPSNYPSCVSFMELSGVSTTLRTSSGTNGNTSPATQTVTTTGSSMIIAVQASYVVPTTFAGTSGLTLASQGNLSGAYSHAIGYMNAPTAGTYTTGFTWTNGGGVQANPIIVAAYATAGATSTLNVQNLNVSGALQTVLSTPASSGAACTAGQIWADINYIYVCTAANAIKRATLATF